MVRVEKEDGFEEGCGGKWGIISGIREMCKNDEKFGEDLGVSKRESEEVPLRQIFG